MSEKQQLIKELAAIKNKYTEAYQINLNHKDTSIMDFANCLDTPNLELYLSKKEIIPFQNKLKHLLPKDSSSIEIIESYKALYGLLEDAELVLLKTKKEGLQR